MNATRFFMSHDAGRAMCSPEIEKVLVDALPVVPTNATSAVPSCLGGVAAARPPGRRQTVQAESRTSADRCSDETRTGHPFRSRGVDIVQWNVLRLMF